MYQGVFGREEGTDAASDDEDGPQAHREVSRYVGQHGHDAHVEVATFFRHTRHKDPEV